MLRAVTPARFDDDRCTCNPDVNWTRFIVERVSDYTLTISVRDQLATVPLGEWLGSSADEGRAKLRKACGTRTEGKNTGFPNENLHRNCFAQWGTPRTETSQYRQEEKTK